MQLGASQKLQVLKNVISFIKIHMIDIHYLRFFRSWIIEIRWDISRTELIDK